MTDASVRVPEVSPKHDGREIDCDVLTRNGVNYYRQRVGVEFIDSYSLDSFGKLRAVMPYGLWESKLITNRKREQWEERLWGAIINHGTVTGAGFAVGETITGGTSGMKGVITAKTASSVTFTTSNNDWADGETITGGTSGSTAAITNHNTGADIVYNYDKASCALSVGTVSGQRAVRQTNRYFPYVAGYAQLINISNTFDTPKANLRQTIMYGDDLNGIGMQMDGLIPSILVRTNTSGSAITTRIPREDWDDKLDGSGPSGITVDFSNSQIGTFDFQWLGVGRRRISLNIGGKSIHVHEINQANIHAGVYMRTPSLPIRYEIENIGTTASSSTLEQICNSIMSEGGYSLPGDEFSVSHTWAQERSVSTRTPILAIRLKTEFPAGKPNRRQLRFLDIQCFTRTTDAIFELVHVHNPLTMTAGWVDVDLDSSSAEYSHNISALTAEHFHPVQHLHVAASAGDKSAAEDITSQFVNLHSYISQNFESTNSQMFVIYATARAGTANVCAHFAFLESE